MLTPTPQRLAVLIPVRDGGALLAETLRSLAAQTRAPDEVLLLDDGSTEPEALRILAGLAPPYRVLAMPRRGPGEARNTGVRATAAELILPLDSDDLLAPDALARLEAALLAEPEAAFASCAVESFGAERSTLPAVALNPYLELDENLLVVTALIRREVFTAHGCWYADLPGFEDWSFWISVAERGLRGAQVQAPLFRYRRKRRSGLLWEARRRRAELIPRLQALHAESYTEAGRARLKAAGAPGLELLWSGRPEDPGLRRFLDGQALDDLLVSTAHEGETAAALLERARGRFLLPLGPADLTALAGCRPSLLELACAALEGRPEAAALIASGRLALLASAPPWPVQWRPEPLAPGDLLLFRTASAAGLRRREAGPSLTAHALLDAPLTEGRALLLALDFLGRRARPEGAPPAPRLSPPPGDATRERVPLGRLAPLWPAWRRLRETAVRLGGEERVAAALQPLKTTARVLIARRAQARDAARDRVDPPLLDPGRARTLRLLDQAPLRHRRLAPLASGPGRRAALVTHTFSAGGVERALIEIARTLHAEGFRTTLVTTLPDAHAWEARIAPFLEDVLHLGGTVPERERPQAIADALHARGTRACLVSNSWAGYGALPLLRAATPELRAADYQHTDFQASGADFARVSCQQHDRDLTLRLVSTEYLFARYRHYGVEAGKVRVIRAGCDEREQFNPERVAPGWLRGKLGLDAHTPLVGFVGRLAEEKDPLFVASVFGALGRALPAARFVLLGDGALREPLLLALAREGLEGRATLLPGDTPVAPVLRDLSLLLMASRQEGLPLVMTEAMALETPVVSTTVEGIPELVTSEVGACVVNAEDPAVRRRLLVEAALPVLRDPALQRRLGLAARARIERDFGIEATRAAWRQVFASLTGEAG